MAQVPVIQDRLDLVNPGAQLRTQASPDAFGALQARALTQIQAGLESVARVADEKDAEFDEADALGLDAQLAARQRDRLYNPETGYLSTARGSAALERRGEVEAGLQSDIEEIAQNARSERSRAAFRDVASRRTRGALDQMAVHLANQTERYRSEQVQAQIGQATDNLAAMIAAGDTPQTAVDAQVSTIIGYVDEEATRLHWSPEQRTQAIEHAQSSAYALAIRQAAQISPDRAREIFNRVSPALAADDRLALEGVMTQADREAENQATDAAWIAAFEGRPPDYTRVSGRNRIAISEYLRNRAQGRDDAGDPDLATNIDILRQGNRNAFLNLDLNEFRGRLSRSEFRRLAGQQASLRERPGVDDVGRAFAVVRSAAEQALNLDLTPSQDLGPSGGTANAEARRNELAGARDAAGPINRALYREVEAFMNANPGVVMDSATTRILIGRAVTAARNGARLPEPWRAYDPVEGLARDVQTQYSSIPAPAREAIERNLKARGLTATPDRVVQDYLAMGGRL